MRKSVKISIILCILLFVGITQSKTIASEATAFYIGNAINYGDSNDSLWTNRLTSQVDNITMEAWVKADTLSAPNQYVRIMYNGNSGNSGYGIYIYNNKPCLLIGGVAVGEITGATLNTSIWYHLAAVRSNGVWVLYVNGNPYYPNLSSGQSTPNPLNATDEFSIGNSSYADENFQGCIDEVRFWTVARSSQQIKNNMYIKLGGNETGLLAYYNFDQEGIIPNGNNVGMNTVTDVTGGNHDLNISSFALNGDSSNFVNSVRLGTISLESESYTVRNNSILNIQVNRSPQSEGIVTINYETEDVTAIHGIHYQATQGTLTFQQGQESANISLVINNSELTENKTFKVNLSAANGVEITPNKSALVTITPYYKIDFNSNGGTGEMSSIEVTNGESSILPECTFIAQEGKHFSGWSIGYADSLERVPSGSEYTQASSVTCYATWETNSYTVNYVGNKPEGSSGVVNDLEDSVNYTYYVGFFLPSPTLIGYYFNGWYKDAECSQDQFLDNQGAYVMNLVEENNGEITLYGSWVANWATPFRVEHYVMNTDGTYPLEASKVDNKNGTTDARFNLVDYKDSTLEVENGIVYKEGKVGNTVETTTTVLADGSRVIKLYYERKAYNISIDSDNGFNSISGVANNSASVYYGKTVNLFGVLKDGYAFVKWNSNDDDVIGDGSELAYSFTMPAASINFQATSVETEYEVTLSSGFKCTKANSNKANFFEEYTTTIIPNKGYYLPATITMTMGGLNFTGFDYNYGTGEITIEAGQITDDIIIDGRCYLLSYYIYFYDNNSLVYSNETYTIEDTQYETRNTLTRPGYRFLGWKVTKAAEGGEGFELNDVYQPNTTYELSRVYGDVEITDQWEPITYTVKFNENVPMLASTTVDNFPSENQSCTYDQVSTLPADCTLEGYTFGGWFKDAQCTQPINTNNALNLTTNNDSTVDIYAKWVANSYTVNYDDNEPEGCSSTVENSIDSISYTFDVAFNLPTQTLTGYTFSGWYKDAACSPNKYVGIENTNAMNLVSANNGEITLYAKWTPRYDTALKVEHYVMNTDGTYPSGATKVENKQGTSDTEINLVSYKDIALVVENGIVYKEGKVGDTVKTTTTVLADGSRVIKLYYERIKHNVSMVAGPGVESVPTGEDYYYGQNVVVQATLLNDAIVWTNWTKVENDVTVVVSTEKDFIYQVTNSDVVLTANTEYESYEVSHHIDFGSTSSPVIATNIENYNCTLVANNGYELPDSITITMGGNNFEEFNYSNSTGLVTIEASNIDGDIVISGSCVLKDYTVSYSAATIPAGSYNLETTSYTLPQAPTKTGYRFDGWKVTTGSQGGTGFVLNTRYDINTSEITLANSYGNAVLTAQWIANIYTITYNSNSGTGTMSNGKASHGTSFTLPTCTFTAPEGKQFKAWAIGSSKGTDLNAGDSYSFTANTTVYAIWEDIPVEIEEREVTEGKNGEWSQNDTSELNFVTAGDYSGFRKISVDGKEISSEDYNLQADRKKVGLKPSFLKTLPAGKHTLRIDFTDGYAETEFTINAATNTQKNTGNTVLIFSLLGLIIAAIVTFVIVSRKKSFNKA